MIEFLRQVRTYFYENFQFFVNTTHKSSQHSAYQVLRILRQIMVTAACNHLFLPAAVHLCLVSERFLH